MSCPQLFRVSLILIGGVATGHLPSCAQATGEIESQPTRSGDSIEIADAQVSLIQNTFIAAPISGVVAAVSVAEGDRVEHGSRLVQLDNEQAQSELLAAKAAFEAAELISDNDVDSRYAKRTLEVRQRELEQSVIANRQFPGSVSETEIAKLQLVVDQSRLAIEQAQQELKVSRAKAREKRAAAAIAEARLRKHEVQAPVSGSAVEVAVQVGEWVEAGEPMVRIISLNPIRVECFVDGRLHGHELVGRSVEFVPSRGDTDGESAGADSSQSTPLTGIVTFVSPELHPVTGQARVWATIDNPSLSARAGMRGQLVIHAK